MKYVQPIGAAENAPYIDADPGAGIEGSPVPAAAIEHPMREIEALIAAAGLVASPGDLTQLLQAVVKKGFQGSYFNTGVPGGAADAIIGTYTPAITEIVNGMVLYVRAGAANETTTPTFTPAAGVVAAKVIEKGEGVALVAGDISGSGHMLALQYDQTNDKWRLLNSATPSSTVTSGNDAAFASNGVKPASTGWVRGAMSAIATAAGFAISLSANGYVKFPSWLGGIVFQWAGASIATLSPITFPIAFPVTALKVFPAWIDAAGYAYVSSYNQSNTIIGHNFGAARTIYVFAIGY